MSKQLSPTVYSLVQVLLKSPDLHPLDIRAALGYAPTPEDVSEAQSVIREAKSGMCATCE